MDIQEQIDNMMLASRAKSMSTSRQLTLSELILKLEMVENKELPLYFDDTDYRPTGIGSWRGSYRELAISFTREGTYGGYNSDKITWESSDGEYKTYEKVSTELPDDCKVSDLFKLLSEVKGKTFEGYKGGDFTMNKSTPIWVADYSESSGFKEGEDLDSQGVVDVEELHDKVVLKSDLVNL